jgi:apolipoprotein D and lipocalin family protein
MKHILLQLLTAASLISCANTSDIPPVSPALQSIASLEVKPYLGTWYQLALFPNRFQAQCISDTTASYSANADGTITVKNRCKTTKGTFDEALGQARAVGKLEGTRLAPAQLEVRFAPAWLSWLPLVWGNYWVIDLAGTPEQGYRYALISEPKREYLWVLSRTPKLSAEDDARIRATLTRLGFDLSKLQAHLHGNS